MIRYALPEEAKRVVLRWNGKPSSVEHIGDHGNSIFSFKNSMNELQILRFTDPQFRSLEEVLGELSFINHLSESGVGVAPGLETADGSPAFIEKCFVGDLICSSIEFAPGVEVKETTNFWGRTFFYEWGRNLGQIHNASITFGPSSHGPFRWSWDKEILLEQAEELIPGDDRKSLEELREVLSVCNSLSKTTSNFGVIHADHAPQNFRYDPIAKRITTFDFGNCCYHWFISDIAISLSTVRRKENRDEIRDHILNGYASVRELPDRVDELIDLFIRLRVIYVYLSRLHMWSVGRTPEQERSLVDLKMRVHAQTGWNEKALA